MPSVKLSARARGVAVALVGVAFLLVAAWHMQRAWRLTNGREVQGRVQQRDEGARQVVVRYPGLKQSEEQTFDVSPERLSKLRRGAKVGVVVVAEGEAYLQGAGPNAASVVLPFLLGVAIAGVGVVMAVREPSE